jgi:hypothetical protein
MNGKSLPNRYRNGDAGRDLAMLAAQERAGMRLRERSDNGLASWNTLSSAIRLLKPSLKEDKSLTGDTGRFVIYYIFRYDPAQQHRTKALFWEAKLDHYGQSVDQRIKFAGWMNEFTRRGGDLVINDAGAHDIDGYSKSHDLALVAAGRGEINSLFERDTEKSPYDRPMRVSSYAKSQRWGSAGLREEGGLRPLWKSGNIKDPFRRDFGSWTRRSASARDANRDNTDNMDSKDTRGNTGNPNTDRDNPNRTIPGIHRIRKRKNDHDQKSGDGHETLQNVRHENA